MNKIEKYLKKINIEYETRKYTSICNSALEASKIINFPFQQMYKSLLCVNNLKYTVLVIQSSKKINPDYEKNYKLVSQQDVAQISGYKIGSVSPICLNQNIRVLIDKSVKAYDKISIGCGEYGKELIISPNDLIKITKAKVVKIT